MIRDEDVEFHATDPDQPNWAETNYFGFYNAEERLNVGAYALFRPNLGVVQTTVCMNSQPDALQPWKADYADYRGHCPIPEPRSLANYSLDSGLTVRTITPNRDWQVSYDDGKGVSFDILWTGLHDPFDIQDPEMDPMKAQQLAAADFAWGTAYNGHFDLTGHAEGWVEIRGKRTPIDCVSTMDHSWGPRPERGAPNMSWLHAHFSKDYAVHAIFTFDQNAPGGGTELTLSHGYAVDKGKLYGLKAGHGTTKRDDDLFPTDISLEVTDIRDTTHVIHGVPTTKFSWQCWPNMMGFNPLNQWTSDQAPGQTGWGEVMDFYEIPQLTAVHAARRAG
ncbi:MAG: DUF7065 domain-containing protein [Sporichthyaceae bacterium]